MSMKYTNYYSGAGVGWLGGCGLLLEEQAGCCQPAWLSADNHLFPQPGQAAAGGLILCPNLSHQHKYKYKYKYKYTNMKVPQGVSIVPYPTESNL